MTNLNNTMMNMYYEYECYEHYCGRSTHCHAPNFSDTRICHNT